MIRLARPAEPETLIKNRAKWTTRWITNLQTGAKVEWATQAARKCLQAPLLAFSRGKCAFCEGTLNVTSFIEIEHYLAKTVRQDWVFHWSNLFPACGICNRHKADLDHQGGLLKPDDEDPEPFLWLHPGTGELQPHPILSSDQEARVKATIAAYNLNRGELCTMRFDKMQEVNRWLSRVAEGFGDSPQCQEEWRTFTRPTMQWKFVIRHVLTLRGQAQLADIDREIFLQQP